MRTRYLHIPTWAAVLYALSGAVLIPWTYQLAIDLPERHLARNWDAAWVGLNICMIVLLLSTALLAMHKNIYVVLTASALGTILLIDGWFDILTSRTGTEQQQAIMIAVCFEIPLALLSFYLAIRATNRFHSNK